MLNLAPDQVFAVLLAIAIGTGAGAWLWWLGSDRRKACVAAAAVDRRKQIQADIRARMFGGQL